MSQRQTSMASGFSTRSTTQRAKRAARKVQFTLMVCGTSGTGKTSFINTLIGQPSEGEKHVARHNGEELELQSKTVEIDDGASATKLVLTVIDTPGFGVALDATKDIELLAAEIEYRFDEVLAEESRIRRNPKFKDNRIHACLYFIEATGHGLSELDIVLMKRLCSLVNVIPVLARADQLTPAERQLAKQQTLEDIQHHGINIYEFAADFEATLAASGGQANADDAEYLDMVRAVREAQPFAVVSSSEFDSEGNVLLQRRLPHGTVQIADPDQSDFELLRDSLLESFMAELKDSTRDQLYESYRTHKLSDPRANRSSMLSPEELADHAHRLKEAQLVRDNKMLKDQEIKIQKEIEDRRKALMERERELRELELRLAREREQQAVPYKNPGHTAIPNQNRDSSTTLEGTDSATAEVVASQSAVEPNSLVSGGYEDMPEQTTSEPAIPLTSAVDSIAAHDAQAELEQSVPPKSSARTSYSGRTSPLSILKNPESS